MTTLRAAGHTDIGQLCENNENVRLSPLIAFCSLLTAWGAIRVARSQRYRCDCGSSGLYGPIS